MQSLFGDRAKENFGTLSSEEQEALKRKILDEQGEIREIIVKHSEYKSRENSELETSKQANIEDESKLRVAMFGKENWEAVIANRTVDDLQDIISTIKSQERDKNIEKDTAVVTSGENR